MSLLQSETACIPDLNHKKISFCEKHKSIKNQNNDELGINVSISQTHRAKNISKNQNLRPQQSQIILFTLP